MRKVFDAPGCNFEACLEAEAWCEEHDISVGARDGSQPRGLARGSYAIAKWSGLRPHERAQMDGTMTGDMRSGPVAIELPGDEGEYPMVEPDDLPVRE